MLLLSILLVVGCSGSEDMPEAEGEESQATEGVTGSLPSSYCKTYKFSTQGLESSIEYCHDGQKTASHADIYGTASASFCTGENKITCLGSGAETYCSQQQGGCPENDPYATYDSGFGSLTNAPSRTIAGMQARCYTYSGMEACYHPEYKTLLYFEDQNSQTTIEVTNFVTPASAAKFTVPAAIQ